MTKEDFLAAKLAAREERAQQKRFEEATIYVQSLARTKLVKLDLKRKYETILLDKNSSKDDLHEALINYMKLVNLDGFLKCKLKTLKTTTQEIVDLWNTICKKLNKHPFENQKYSERLGLILLRLIHSTPEKTFFTSKANSSNLTLWVLTIFRCFSPNIWKNKIEVTDLTGQSSSDICTIFYRLLVPIYYKKSVSIALPLLTAVLKLALRCQVQDFVHFMKLPCILKNSKLFGLIPDQLNVMKNIVVSSYFIKRCSSEDLLFIFANCITLLNHKPTLLAEDQIVKTLFLIANKMHKKRVYSFKPGQSYIHPILGAQADKVMHDNEVFDQVGGQIRSMGSATFLQSILARVMILAEQLPDLEEKEIYREHSGNFVFNSWKDFVAEIKQKTTKNETNVLKSNDGVSRKIITENDIDNAVYICLIYSSITYIIHDEKKICNDILVAFSCVPNILERLWKFIASIGVLTFTKAFDLKNTILTKTALKTVTDDNSDNAEDVLNEKVYNAQRLAGILTLFAQCTQLYINVAGIDTLYKKHGDLSNQAISADNVARCAVFFNKLIFDLLYNVLFDKDGNVVDQVQGILHKTNNTLSGDITLDASIKVWRELLLSIYDHDQRRPFVSVNSEKTKKQQFEELEARWQEPSVRNGKKLLCSSFKSGSKNSKFSPVLQGYLPWIYSFKVRVAVFREQIDREKRHYQQNMHQVQIRRDNIVEDAFDQFKGISGNVLKGTIRIKFFNELGLSEAGIDQMGVFKEFIEIWNIKKIVFV